MEVRHGRARVHELVEKRAVRVVEGLVQDGERVFQMSQRTGPDDGRRNARLILRPEQGELRCGKTAFLCQLADGLSYIDAALGHARFHLTAVPTAGA